MVVDMREMKDSGIIWIGEIPKDWTVYRGGYLYKIETGNLDVNAENPDGQYPFFTCSMFPKRIDKWQFDCEALLVAGNGIVGFTLYYNGKFNAYQRTYVLSNFNNIYPAYLKHYVSNNLITEVTPKSQGSVIQFIKYNDLRDFHIVAPCLEKQKVIADFLDSKCAEIDALSADIQSEIDTLEAYKRSVITEAVTKGLDKTVPMKDSGIEWAEKVPAHWKVMQNKYIMKKAKEICPVYHNEDILSLTMNGVIVRDLDAGGKMPASFNGYQIIHPGNLLMCLFDYDVTPRCIGLIRNEGLTSPAYSQFVMKNGNTAEYYYYYYLMIDFTKELLHLAKNLRHSFTEDQLGMINAPVPPIGEQIAIAKYLDEQCAEIEAIIAQKQEQLAVLADYKKSVIYEYVTGKKEVPNE